MSVTEVSEQKRLHLLGTLSNFEFELQQRTRGCLDTANCFISHDEEPTCLDCGDQRYDGCYGCVVGAHCGLHQTCAEHQRQADEMEAEFYERYPDLKEA